MLNNLLTNFLTALSTLLAFFILMFVYTKTAGPIPFSVNSVTSSNSLPFMVTGEGKIEAVPDSATVRLGVAARGATAEAAKNALNTSINKVIAEVKALGVDEKNIKTENFNVYPEYGDSIAPSGGTTPATGNTITGYSANTNISVMVDGTEPVSLANKIVDVGTKEGANLVGGIDFQVKDKTEAMNKAREMAVADAKRKAEDAAKIAGFKLGNIINYSEGQGGNYPMPMMAKANDARAMGGQETNIQPGTNDITMTVTLSYEIR